MEDKLIAFCIVMFVLSQISERISNFFKLYLYNITLRTIEGFRNLDTHTEDEEKEKKRERIILIISLCAGMMATGLFMNILNYIPDYIPIKEDISNKFSEQEHPLAWMKKLNYGFFVAISLLLSFGAKFWHDFLDIVYFYKNARRNLQDTELFKLGSAEEITKRLQQTPNELALMAYNYYKDKILKMTGVVDFARGFDLEGTPCFRVRFEDRDSAAKFEKELFWVDASGFEHRIKVEKIVSGPALTQSGLKSGGIFNAATPDRTGTVGYLFKDSLTKEDYVLSCYHVMRADHQWGRFYQRHAEEIRLHMGQNQSQPIATLYFGYRNQLLDVAIAKINSLEFFDEESRPRITKTAYVDKQYLGTPVKINGMTSGLIDAVIYEADLEVNMKYEDGSIQTFSNFFSLSRPYNLKCPTKNGDSGGLVFRENGEALGIIVGGSKSLAYAMKIPVIEEMLGIKIIPSA